MTGHDAYANVAAYELENPDGEWLLLLLHGLGGDRQQALGLIEGVRTSRFAVVAPDLRAHGETPLVGDADAFTFDAMVADILALLDRLGQASKPVYVAGISMGAAIALRLALSRPVDVRGMALVRPAFGDVPEPDNLIVMPVVARLLRDHDPDDARTVLLASPEYRRIADVTRSGARSVEDQLTKPGASDRAVRLAEIPKNVAWRDDSELRSLELPVVVVGAGRDVMHPLELARRTASLLPAARLAEVAPRDVDPDSYDRQMRAAVQGHLLEVSA